MAKLALGKVIVCDIDNDKAKDLLDNHNSRNRKINRGKVKRYVEDMRSGDFNTDRLFEGKLFYVDVDGELVSAQHRLMAAIEAEYVFRDALMVVIDRDLFNEKSVEARSPREIAQMNLKAESPEVTSNVSDAIHTVTGHKVFLESKKPYVSKRPESYDKADLVEVYQAIGANVTRIFFEFPKASKVAVGALGCLMFAGKISLREALDLVANADLKPQVGTGLLHWMHSFTDHINQVETQPNTEKVFLGR